MQAINGQRDSKGHTTPARKVEDLADSHAQSEQMHLGSLSEMSAPLNSINSFVSYRE
jgi:hypothetical protein